jgi:hypothetical protein
MRRNACRRVALGKRLAALENKLDFIVMQRFAAPGADSSGKG